MDGKEQGKEGQRRLETKFRVEGFRVFSRHGSQRGSEVRSGTGRGSANARLEHGATGVAHHAHILSRVFRPSHRLRKGRDDPQDAVASRGIGRLKPKTRKAPRSFLS